MISGFSFIHNALEGGYPIAEAIKAVEPYVSEVVVVDMQSTDGTRELLQKLNVRIVDGYWGNRSGLMLDEAFNKYVGCQGDIILYFEADEVYDDNLLEEITRQIEWHNQTDIAVYRIQLEQNFQRCKWYPELVHRVFPKYSHARKKGHTIDRHDLAYEISVDFGFLWDISNCFRDNWFKRIENQAKYRAEDCQYLMVPLHCVNEARVDEQKTRLRLNEKHWTWQTTPFNIPEILKPLVGMTKYYSREDINANFNSWR